MQRAVITGIGIVSCLGNDQAAVTESLRAGRSGITRRESYAEIGMRSHVAASPTIDLAEHIGRKQLRFMGAAAAYALYLNATGHRRRRARSGAGLQ